MTAAASGDRDRHQQRAHDDVDVRRLREQLPVRREREFRHDAGRELVDRIEALQQQRQQRPEVDDAEPEQRRGEQQREVERLATLQRKLRTTGHGQSCNGTA